MQSFKDVGGLIGRLLKAGSQTANDTERAQLWLLIFYIGSSPFAINVENTEGVVYCGRVSPLPGAPEGVSGVTSVRGRITLVVDLDGRSCASADTKRLILLKGDSQLGLRSDKVDTVVGINPQAVKSPSVREAADPLGDTLSGLGLIERGSFEYQGCDVPVIDEANP